MERETIEDVLTSDFFIGYLNNRKPLIEISSWQFDKDKIRTSWPIDRVPAKNAIFIRL